VGQASRAGRRLEESVGRQRAPGEGPQRLVCRLLDLKTLLLLFHQRQVREVSVHELGRKFCIGTDTELFTSTEGGGNDNLLTGLLAVVCGLHRPDAVKVFDFERNLVRSVAIVRMAADVNVADVVLGKQRRHRPAIQVLGKRCVRLTKRNIAGAKRERCQ
jgi:hypothetical protein